MTFGPPPGADLHVVVVVVDTDADADGDGGFVIDV